MRNFFFKSNTKQSAQKEQAGTKLNQKKVEQGIRYTITTYGDVLKDLARYDRGAKPRTR